MLSFVRTQLFLWSCLAVIALTSMAPASVVYAQDEDLSASFTEAEALTYNSRGKRDPFISLIYMPGLTDFLNQEAQEVVVVQPDPTGTSDTDLDEGQEEIISLEIQLDGIVWDPVEPMALVNNRAVKIDDVLDQMHIVDIQPRSIVILYRDVEFYFELD